MANPGNQHCANCIGTLSFHIAEVKRFLSPCILYIIITQASRCCRSQYYSAFQWTGKPTKFPLPPGDPEPHLWFTGPSQVHNPSGTSIGSYKAHSCHQQTDRQTHRPHYNCIAKGRIFVLRACMRCGLIIASHRSSVPHFYNAEPDPQLSIQCTCSCRSVYQTRCDLIRFSHLI